MPQKILHLSPEQKDAKKRLDAYVAEALPDVTRSRAKRLIESGNVLVDGKSAKASHAVRVGEAIAVTIPPPTPAAIQPEAIPLEILYEDDEILFVHKPADMVVHPAHRHWSGTLVHALLAHCAHLSNIGGEQKPGIVHRLDKGTSGVMVVAKTDRAHLSLSRQFAAREVEKIYMALVFGKMRALSGTIEQAIGRSRSDRKKMSTKTKKGRNAITAWKVRESFVAPLSLVEINLKTGRTHQIRVHMTEMGHPLVGDPVYGGGRQERNFPAGRLRETIAAFPRPALHAHCLRVRHPITGAWLEQTARLPEDMSALLKLCREEGG